MSSSRSVQAGDRQSSWVRIWDKVGHLVLHRISAKISDDSESWIDSVDTILPEGPSDPAATRGVLARRLEDALREAKLKSVLTTDVLIPRQLTHRISSDVIKMAEVEPCGLKGCVIYILLDDASTRRRIGRVFCDPRVVSTFGVILTLRKDSARNWLSLRHLTGGLGGIRPLVISPDYHLSKRKLYRSSSLEN